VGGIASPRANYPIVYNLPPRKLMIQSREINDSRYFLMIDAIINKHIPGFLHAPGDTAIFAVENNKRKKDGLCLGDG